MPLPVVKVNVKTLTFCSLPSFSKKLSRGAFKPSVQLARKALNKEKEDIPTVFLPTLSNKRMKRNTVNVTIETEPKTIIESAPKPSPVIEPAKKIDEVHKAGCKREEKVLFPTSAKDVVENTNKRSISAPLKPRKKNLTQRLGFLRKANVRLPKKIQPNQIRQEKRERTEQRLKLKIGSLFMELRLTVKSDNKVKKRKVPPKVKLEISPPKEK